MELIDKSAVIAKINDLISNLRYTEDDEALQIDILSEVEKFVNTLEVKDERPEPYFYCKYGGILPLCSDCKRNHKNSSFKTEEITTWYTPLNGAKQCIDYIQQQSEMDLEKEMSEYLAEYPDEFFSDKYKLFAKHFFELGLKAAKEE